MQRLICHRSPGALANAREQAPEGVAPDVGRAIYQNQLYPELNLVTRMEALEKQRKETYAIRELWKSLQQRRAAINKDSRNPSTKHTSRGAFRTDNGSGPFIEQYKQDILNDGSFTDRVCYRGNATYIDNIPGHRRTHGSLSARGVESAPGRLRRSVRDEDIPYHTIITMPPDRRSKTCVGFNALNRKLNCGLPNVYDRGYRPPGYTQADIREWKNEIKKIVPKRPTLFLPATTPLRPMSTLMPPEIERTRDKSVMFRPTVDRNYGRHMEYMVDPEWFSEKITPQSVQNRAHCVYIWNV
ncbi:hypothetical protein ElyMa_004972600 [Elysia marginata]|uniref:Uncharacterized protein n=1 Tax=Elysia marginata TaxID=1093978 RepID=A0AAV4J2S7_9GAST|nr:hypothetical protein ElyMa_004972600 [Elysia marginata]